MSTSAWPLIEEAVLQDLRLRDEEVLKDLARSYLQKHGCVDTLLALESDMTTTPQEELLVSLIEEGGTYPEDPTGVSIITTEEELLQAREYLNMVRRRKEQLCQFRDGRFDELAHLAPPGSVLQVRLLCLEAIIGSHGKKNTAEVLLYLRETVAPLVIRCSDPSKAHHVLLSYMALLVDRTSPETVEAWRRKLVRQVEDCFDDLDEVVAPQQSSSDLAVVLSWVLWQSLCEANEVS